MFDTDDVIVAVSSAAGSAARAVVRVSGPGAISLAGRVFVSEPSLERLGGFRAIEGVLTLRGGLELPGAAYVFRAPRSFTSQDLVELHIPGAAALAGELVDELIARGARQARAGEFTARAFFAGRIDLSAAQAVADVIDAADQSQISAAMWALDGSLARLCRQATDELTDALGSVEASIDLAEEQLELESPAQLTGKLAALQGRLAELVARSADLPELADRPRVVLAGLPNAGKSSLLNALAGADRAIVSAMAGTTRDVLTAMAELAPGQSAELVDAAGLASAPGTIEMAAQQAAWTAVRRADALVAVVDLSRPDYSADLTLLSQLANENPTAPLLLAGNKADLVTDGAARLAHLSKAGQTALSTIGRTIAGSMAVSALRGDGLIALRDLLAEQLGLSRSRGGEALGLHRSQRRSLEAAAQAIDRARQLLVGSAGLADQAELTALELRDALGQLGAIVGAVASDDVLAGIFRRFCVGK